MPEMEDDDRVRLSFRNDAITNTTRLLRASLTRTMPQAHEYLRQFNGADSVVDRFRALNDATAGSFPLAGESSSPYQENVELE